jgi:hypothetical protein
MNYVVQYIQHVDNRFHLHTDNNDKTASNVAVSVFFSNAIFGLKIISKLKTYQKCNLPLSYLRKYSVGGILTLAQGKKGLNTECNKSFLQIKFLRTQRRPILKVFFVSGGGGGGGNAFLLGKMYCQGGHSIFSAQRDIFYPGGYFLPRRYFLPPGIFSTWGDIFFLGGYFLPREDIYWGKYFLPMGIFSTERDIFY